MICYDIIGEENEMSRHTDELLEAVHEIAEIIHMQLPLRYQDAWLKDIMGKGIWKPETAEVGVCCRNGCERCEQ